MRELEEARLWLATARTLFEDSSKGKERFTVVVAQAIHGLIRANDALTVHFLDRRSTRHEDAAKLFRELIRQNKIPGEHAGLRDVIVEAIADKSDFDYKGTEVSQAQAMRWLRKTERFLDSVDDVLGKG